MYVKELLVEALARANHVKRGFPASADEIKMSEGYFNSALRKYSGDNLITAFQKVYTFTPSTEETTIGKPSYKRGKIVHYCRKSADIPNVTPMVVSKDYCLTEFGNGVNNLHGLKVIVTNGVKSWEPCELSEFCDSVCDKFCYDMNNVVKAMTKNGSEWIPLDFVPMTEFYTNIERNVFNCSSCGENKVKFIIRDFWVNNECRIIYNTSMKFTSKDYIELPEDQVEMLTLAVEKAILMEDGDADQSMLTNVQVSLKELEDNISARNATTRRIVRSTNRWETSPLIRGTFICR